MLVLIVSKRITPLEKAYTIWPELSVLVLIDSKRITPPGKNIHHLARAMVRFITPRVCVLNLSSVTASL